MYAVVKENPTHFRMINSFQLRTRKSANEFKKTLPNWRELLVIKLDENPYPMGNITEYQAPTKNLIKPYNPKLSKMNAKIEMISGSSKVKVRTLNESILLIDLQAAVNYCNKQDLYVTNKEVIPQFFARQLKR